MTWPASLLRARTLIRKARTSIITGLAVAGLCLPLGYCAGRRAAPPPAIDTKAVAINERARDNADQARAADGITIIQHEQELTNAISQVPDTKPDAVRVALGCQRLRAQGAVEADLPADCRPEGDRHP